MLCVRLLKDMYNKGDGLSALQRIQAEWDQVKRTYTQQARTHPHSHAHTLTLRQRLPLKNTSQCPICHRCSRSITIARIYAHTYYSPYTRTTYTHTNRFMLSTLRSGSTRRILRNTAQNSIWTTQQMHVSPVTSAPHKGRAPHRPTRIHLYLCRIL